MEISTSVVGVVTVSFEIPANRAKYLFVWHTKKIVGVATVSTRQNLNSQADHAADLLQRVAVVFRCLWKSLGRIFDQKMDILQGILATHLSQNLTILHVL